jgi:hypothetical protein
VKIQGDRCLTRRRKLCVKNEHISDKKSEKEGKRDRERARKREKEMENEKKEKRRNRERDGRMDKEK